MTTLLQASEFEALLATDKDAKFERGKSMTVQQVADVVGPEFQEMNEDPPESVVRLREEMQKAAAAKAGAAGLYGSTRDVERCCTSSVNQLKKAALKLARNLYARDEETPAFLAEHSKRASSRPARLLVAAMKELGPFAAKTAKSRSGLGLYGFKEATAKSSLEACTELRHTAGVLASDLNARRTAAYEGITGFFKEHSKQARCAYSGMLLEAYPTPKTATPKTASEDITAAEIEAWNAATDPSNSPDLGLLSERMAADFLAAEDEDETPRAVEASVAPALAKVTVSRLVNLMTGAGDPAEDFDSLAVVFKRMQAMDPADQMGYVAALKRFAGAYLKRVL